MKVPTRTTRAELAQAMEAMPIEMVVAGFMVNQLKRITDGTHEVPGTYRRVKERQRLAIHYVEKQLGL